MGISTEPVDFGNGIIAYLTRSPIIAGYSGATDPTWDLDVQENSMTPGGSIGAAREQTPLMTFRVVHEGEYPPDMVRLKFQPNVEYWITSERGTMPYRVVSRSFPEDLRQAETEFSVTLRSPWPYPIKTVDFLRSGSISEGLTFPLSFPASFESAEPNTSIIMVNNGFVATEPTIKITPAFTGPLTLTFPSGDFTLDVTSGAEIIIDSPNRTVTSDGVSAMAAMDRSSIWPVLQTGSNHASFSQPVVADISWPVYAAGII